MEGDRPNELCTREKTSSMYFTIYMKREEKKNENLGGLYINHLPTHPPLPTHRASRCWTRIKPRVYPRSSSSFSSSSHAHQERGGGGRGEVVCGLLPP